MLRDVLAEIINSLLGSYVKNLSKKNLKLSILDSRLCLNDLELSETCFLIHDIPITVKKGIIRSINAQIPCVSLFKEPFSIKISDIMIDCQSYLSDTDWKPDKMFFQDIRKKQLVFHSKIKSSLKMLLSFFTDDFATTILDRILVNSKIEIERMNIRINFGNNVLGIVIDNLSIDNMIKSTNNHKCITLKGIVMYFDIKVAKFSDENQIFIQQMMNSLRDSHSIIFDHDIIEGEMSLKPLALFLKLGDPKAFMTLEQIRSIFQIIENIPRFFPKWIHRMESFTDPNYFWDRAHYYAIGHENKQVRTFLSNLRALKHYRSEWDNLSKNTCYLDFLLPYQDTVCFRDISEYLCSSSFFSNNKMSNLYKIMQFCEFDPIILLPRLLFSTSVSIDFLSFSTQIHNLLIITNNMSLYHGCIKRGFLSQVSFSSFQIKSRIKELYLPVIGSVEKEKNCFFIRIVSIPKSKGLKGEFDLEIKNCDFMGSVNPLIELLRSNFGDLLGIFSSVSISNIINIMNQYIFRVRINDINAFFNISLNEYFSIQSFSLECSLSSRLEMIVLSEFKYSLMDNDVIIDRISFNFDSDSQSGVINLSTIKVNGSIDIVSQLSRVLRMTQYSNNLPIINLGIDFRYHLTVVIPSIIITIKSLLMSIQSVNVEIEIESQPVSFINIFMNMGNVSVLSKNTLNN